MGNLRNDSEVNMSRKTKAAEFIDETYTMMVTGRNLEVTDALRDYVFEKVGKMEKFSNRILDVNVTIEKQKTEHRVEIVAKIDTILLNSHASTDNMYASIDKAVDKLEVQLKKYKDKLHVGHHAKKAQDVMMTENVLRSLSAAEINAINDDIEDENRRRLIDKYHPHHIVSKETRPLHTLANGEAIVKLEQTNDPFVVYRSEEDQKLKIIYRREDGDFGVVEVQI